jgi:transposase, IS605 orfB family
MTDNTMLLVEKQIIRPSNPLYKELDHLCFLSKNLYNATLYTIRQHYFETNKYQSFFTTVKNFTKENQVDFRALPANVSRYTVLLVDQNMRAFFALLKKKKANQYTKPVRLPKYLDKINGRQVVHYNKQFLGFKKDGFVKLSKSDIEFKTKVPKSSIQYLKLVPCGNHIKVLIGYYKTKKKTKNTQKRIASIDVGQNNLMTVTSNVFHPVIYNGKPVKSVNQFYNKIKAKEQSRLNKQNNVYWSKKLGQLTLWRENQINNYFHKVTHHFVNYCIANDIDTVIIGRNQQWKDSINLGKKINQNFVSIPFGKLYDLLKYKLELNGINYIETEESHTSKCSFIDKEEITHHDSYVGRRIKRGLFRSKEGIKYNADINGSLNILRKYMTKTGTYTDDLHEELVRHMTNPRKLKVKNK